MYELAVTEAGAGRHADAIRWLEKAEALGCDFDLAREPAFAPLKKFESYRELAHRSSLLAPARSSAVAFRIAEPDLVPEGIAYDPVSKSFFVGSLAKKKIVRITPDGAAKDFVPSGRDGLWTVLGLKVDAKRRILWAASAADGREGPAAGSSALLAFEIPSGALRARHVLDGTPRKHLWNDLAVTTAGDVFVTDSEAGAVYRLAPGGGSLEEWLPADTFAYPNGIALDPEEKRLYVADFAKGLSIVEIATKKVRPVFHPRAVTLHAIDGLSSFRGSLVAIQNGPGMERVARLFLDPAGERVTGIQVIESRNPDFDLPTTGAVAEGDYYYLANSQLESLGDDGRLKAGVRLREVLVFRARLE
jgi:DNA-binding beta-propeller fold protein YncE